MLSQTDHSSQAAEIAKVCKFDSKHMIPNEFQTILVDFFVTKDKDNPCLKLQLIQNVLEMPSILLLVQKRGL